MTLIDLQGKALYSGDKEVKIAYLGEQVLYKLSGGVPTYAIEPQIAVYAGNGELTAYAGVLDDFLAKTEGTQTITSDSLYFEGDGYIQHSRSSSSTIEITVKNTTNDYPEGHGTILSIGRPGDTASGGMADITYTNSSSGGLSYRLRTGNSTIRRTYPAPNTEFVTFAIKADVRYDGRLYNVYIDLYINGEVFEKEYKEGVSTFGSAVGTLRIGRNTGNNLPGKFHLVDFKNYNTSLTPEEVMQSYQLLNI